MPGLGPVFLLQIVRVEPPHAVVLSRFQAGGQMEVNIEDEIVVATKAKGVGVGRTEAQVEAALRLSIKEVFTALKEQTRGLVAPITRLR